MTRSFKLPHRSMLLALACTLVGTTGLAQDPFPSKSVRIVAPGAPGGGKQGVTTSPAKITMLGGLTICAA